MSENDKAEKKATLEIVKCISESPGIHRQSERKIYEYNLEEKDGKIKICY